ncbi:uncharacterized protein LOC119111407 [Pollicipes pollicipes]|uniref:uncharacterized protein LOC119111407 n=1 Tax=Pollicipes pollicipes TaxID=41117 RepID=UPI0018850702|nr:uncharacterized protein LOC119111407 [Pollicipes pollicipes]
MSDTLRAALAAPLVELALRVHELTLRRRLLLEPSSLRGLLLLRLRLKHFNRVRLLYNQGLLQGVYPRQQAVATQLEVRLPCWLTGEEMLVVLEEFVRSVSERLQDAAQRLQQACRLLAPPLRLQPCAAHQFLVTGDSLGAKYAETVCGPEVIRY